MDLIIPMVTYLRKSCINAYFGDATVMNAVVDPCGETLADLSNYFDAIDLKTITERLLFGAVLLPTGGVERRDSKSQNSE